MEYDTITEYIEKHEKEAFELLLELAQIPAPSNHEEKRAQFCLEWLKSHGAEGAYVMRPRMGYTRWGWGRTTR